MYQIECDDRLVMREISFFCLIVSLFPVKISRRALCFPLAKYFPIGNSKA